MASISAVAIEVCLSIIFFFSSNRQSRADPPKPSAWAVPPPPTPDPASAKQLAWGALSSQEAPRSALIGEVDALGPNLIHARLVRVEMRFDLLFGVRRL
jgi:hypothetical protein